MNKEIRGYTQHGVPIYRCESDCVYTAAIVQCSVCKTVIRGAGGPMYGAKCLECSPQIPKVSMEYRAKQGEGNWGNWAPVTPTLTVHSSGPCDIEFREVTQ